MVLSLISFALLVAVLIRGRYLLEGGTYLRPGAYLRKLSTYVTKNNSKREKV